MVSAQMSMADKLGTCYFIHASSHENRLLGRLRGPAMYFAACKSANHAPSMHAYQPILRAVVMSVRER